MPQYFFLNICLVRAVDDFFKRTPYDGVQLMKWQIFERNQYWHNFKTAESLNFCRDLCWAMNFLFSRDLKKNCKKIN